MPRLPPAALRKKHCRTAKSMTENQTSKKNEDHPASAKSMTENQPSTKNEDHPASTKGEQPRRPKQYKSASKICSASSTMMSKVDANAKILGIAYSAKKYGFRNTLERLSNSYILHDNEDKLKKKGKEFDPEVVLTEILFIVRDLQERAKTQTKNTRLPQASRLPWVRKESTRDPSSQPATEETVKSNPTQGTVEHTNATKEHPSSQPLNEANPHVESQERAEHTDEPNESDEDGFLSSAWNIICDFVSKWFID